jgi:hypothetical protein
VAMVRVARMIMKRSRRVEVIGAVSFHCSCLLASCSAVRRNLLE